MDLANNKLVEALGLSYSVRLGKNSLPILSDLNFTIDEGEFVALQGPSGSGKSTLLHLVGTLLKPTQGKVFIGGINPFQLSDFQLARFRCNEVGFIFQQFHIFPNLTLLENIVIPTWLPFEDFVPDPTAYERAKELASTLGVSTRLDHYPHQLSGGQLQRLVIARALMRKPRILFADEPTGNLDSKNAAETIKIFRTLNEEFGQTIFLVTHDPGVANEASRKITMVDGKISSDEIIRDKSKFIHKNAMVSNKGQNEQEPTRQRTLLSFAIQNLRKNWRRSALTVVGIFVGIASTFFLGSLGTFVQNKVVESYRDMGISAFKFHAYPNWMGADSKKAQPFSQLDLDKDIVPLRRVFPEIVSYSPIILNWEGGKLVYGGRTMDQNTRINGVSKEFFEISSWKTQEGKIFSHYEEKYASDICVLGARIKEKLFKNLPATGQMLEVDMQDKTSVCRVVGVLEDRKFGSQWDDPNDALYVPFTNIGNYTARRPDFMNFLAKVKDGVDMGVVGTSVENFFKKKYGTSGEFRADRNSMLLAQMQKFTRLMKVFLFFVSLICLSMGGVGLMNMMLVSVSERLSELALLQALGASSTSLKKGVILESLLLCVIAGVGGVVAAFGGFHLLLWVTSKFVSQVSFEWHFDGVSLVLSIVAIFVVAIASSIIPAKKAANLEIAHSLKGR